MHASTAELPSAWESAFRRFGIIWFSLAAIGQTGFVVFITAYYGPRTATGNFAAWNDKQLVEGHAPGDGVGNAMFAAHVLLAAVMTFGGLLQLMPAVRNQFRAFHRWNGRLFLALACFLAAGGLWLTWMRGTYLSWEPAVIISLNAVLILAFAVPTVRTAMAYDFASHQRWAMRTFMAANGVWFFRVGIMGWMLLTQSTWGMTGVMNGPVDLALAAGCYLIPLFGLELYYGAQRSPSTLVKAGALGLLILLTAFMAVGIAGTLLIMWPGDLRA